jgi:type IV pilus assembly protein PilA
MELLVAVSIVGVLAAIAMPQYSNYRKKAYDAKSLEDLKTAATGEEAYNADNEHFVDCIGAQACAAVLPGYKPSTLVNISMFQVLSGTSEYYTGRTYHPNGTRSTLATAYMWNSMNGGLQ